MEKMGATNLAELVRMVVQLEAVAGPLGELHKRAP
jgi:hypothetical protein